MSHYAPPPAEGMGSNRFNTIRLIPCILQSSVSIYLIHHQLILAQLEEWEGDLQNALHSQMSERIESSSRNVFFIFLFDFQILYFLPFFSSSGSRAMTREAAEERAEGFPRFSHFSHVENSQKKSFTFWFWLILNSYKNVYALLLFMTYSHNLLNIKAKSRAN